MSFIGSFALRDPRWWAGLGLAAGIAALAVWLGAMPWFAAHGFSALTVAIVLGLLLGNTVFPYVATRTAPGVDFAKGSLLRIGIVLYGLRLSFQDIAQVGWSGVLIAGVMLTATYLLAVRLGTRVFGLDRETSVLIGAGASICGAAAVLATEPVVKAQAHKVSVAVATVVVFGTLAMFVYPLLQSWLQLSEHAYGIYVGSSVHEVAQVVAAGRAVSEQAASTAVIEKMLRVMMLAPFLLLLSRSEGQGSGRVMIPWFAVLFLLVCGINSLGVLPPALVSSLVWLDTLILATAMAALGLRTHVGAVKQAGIKPLLLAASLFVFLVLGGYGLNRLVLG